MKKKLNSAIALGLALVLFAGCAKGAAPNTQPSPSSASAQTDAPTTTGDTVELTIWEQASKVDDRFKAEIDDFMAKNPNIKVNITITEPGDGSELMAAIAAGTAPDLCSIAYPMMDKYIYANAMEDLTDYIAKWDDAKNINQDMLDMFKVNGKYYGVPSQQYSMVLVYNKALFEEAGVTVPTNWEEFSAAAKKLTIPERQQYGFALNWAQWADWWFEMFVWAAGGDLTKAGANGELELTFTDPAVTKAAEFYRQLKADKVIQPDDTMQLDPLKQDFVMGKAAMILDGSDSAGEYVSKGMKPEDVGIAPIPAGPSGKGPMQVGGSLYAIPKNADKAKVDAAFELLKYYMSKEAVDTKIKTQVENGFTSFVIYGRTDIKLSDYFEIPEDTQKTLDIAAQNGRREFYGKGIVGAFVDKAVQEIMVNPSVDIESVFKKYADEAMKKEVPDFNSSLTTIQ